MKFNSKYLFFAISVLVLFASGVGDALAQSAPGGAQDFGSIAERGATQGNALIKFLQVLFIVCGIALIGGGIFALVKDAKQQGNGPVSKGAAAIMIVAGGALTFITSMVDTTGQSIWGEEGGSRAKIEIEQ